jgi:hypothetical protein
LLNVGRYMRKVRKPQWISERFVKMVLTIFAVLLIFGGPTYLLYVLQRLGIPSVLFTIVGLAAFTAGVILFMHLAKEEI